MRIALVINKLTGGGAERVATMWATGFCQQGHTVCMIITDDKSPKTYPLPTEVEVISADVSVKSSVLSKIRERIVTPFVFRKIFKRWSPDVVISVLPWWMRNIKWASIGLNLKIISTDHNSFQRPDDAKMSFRMYLKKFYFQGWADAITVLTQADKDYIGNRLKNVYVLPNPLAFEPIEKDDLKREKIILAMGRLDAGHYKGFDILIKAFGMTQTDWSLQIVGAGSHESLDKYKKMAKDCGIENRVQFLDYTDDPVSLFRRASIFILSSRYEGFGLVLIEAMSQRCACIACDYFGRQKEILCDEKYGMTCLPGDVEALAKAIERMIEDEEYRKSCQHNAPQRAADYKLENIMDIWNKIFKEVI